jgi:glyoxylate/succinic semialdehyde reductase
MSAGKGYVDVSTVDAATSATIADAIRKQGGSFLEAPVSGSKKPAEDGKLIFLAAGRWHDLCLSLRLLIVQQCYGMISK